MNISDNRNEERKATRGLGRGKFRFSRAYEMTAEFLKHQGGFEFAAVTDVVLKIAADAKKAMWTNFDKWLKGFRSAPETKKPEQLRLDLLNWLKLANVSALN